VASVTASAIATPLVDAIAVVTSPAVQMPNASSPASRQCSNAAASAVPVVAASSAAVARS